MRLPASIYDRVAFVLVRLSFLVLVAGIAVALCFPKVALSKTSLPETLHERLERLRRGTSNNGKPVDAGPKGDRWPVWEFKLYDRYVPDDENRKAEVASTIQIAALLFGLAWFVRKLPTLVHHFENLDTTVRLIYWVTFAIMLLALAFPKANTYHYLNPEDLLYAGGNAQVGWNKSNSASRLGDSRKPIFELTLYGEERPNFERLLVEVLLASLIGGSLVLVLKKKT